MRQVGLAAYLRNLSVRTTQLARRCDDAHTRQQLADLCEDIANRAESVETIFEVEV